MEIFNTSGLGSITPSNNREQQEVGFEDFFMHSLEDLDNDEAFNTVKQAVLVEFQADIKLLEDTKQKVTNSSLSTEKKDHYLAKLTELLTQLQSLQNDQMNNAADQFHHLKKTFFHQLMGQMKLPENMFGMKETVDDFLRDNEQSSEEADGLSSSELFPSVNRSAQQISGFSGLGASGSLFPSLPIGLSNPNIQQADIAILNEAKEQAKKDIEMLVNLIQDIENTPSI